MNVMMLLEMSMAGFGDRTAVGRRGHDLTYLELFERAGRAAAAFQADGVRHVAYVGTNGPAFPLAVFASAWAGASFIPMNYRMGAEQLVALLDEHDDTLVIADESLVGIASSGRHPVIEREQWYAGTSEGEAAVDWGIDPEAIALLLYTSGTTSAPKAAILRHRHLVSYVIGSVDYGGADEADAALVSVPPYHIAGVANLLSNIYAARRLVYLDGFTPQSWLTAAREQAVTQAMVVPTMLARIVQALGDAPDAGLPSLRSLAYGGSRMPVPVVARALQLFPSTDFVNAYGLTETSSTIAVLGPDDHRAAVASDDPADRARLGSAGRIIPGVEAEVRSFDGDVLGADETGELWVRGEQVSGEYLSRESPLDEHGWFPTRDRARIDAQGYLFIEGRADDTIIRGGENIAPAEIEDVLLHHPSVAEAIVVGPADDEWGQRIAAVVVPLEGETIDPDRLRDWARERLRSSKTPDQIVIWGEVPHTATGKVIRREILQRLEEGVA